MEEVSRQINCYENQMRYKKKRNDCSEVRKAKLDFELKISEKIKEDDGS